jgi:HK97 family phage major capsid protein
MTMNPKLRELREAAAYLQDELRAIHASATDAEGEIRSLDEDEDTRFRAGADMRDEMIVEADALEARLAAVEVIAQRPEAREDGTDMTAPNVIRDADPFDETYQRSVGIREAAKRYVGESRRLNEGGQEATTELLENRSGNVYVPADRVARHLLAHGSDMYSSAFAKMAVGRGHDLDDGEREALRHAQSEERAINITTDATGAVLMPTHLDPTVIYSGNGSVNPFRQISRVITVTGDNWQGVTSTGVSSSWDAESAEVSDDTPAYVQPAISIHKGQAFVPVTYEALQDFAGLGNDVAVMFRDSKDDLEATAFATGTGSAEPYGIAVAAVSSPGYTAMATNSSFAIGDVFTASEALPARYRGQNPVWVMNQTHINDVMEMGGTSYYTRSATLDQGPSGSILGRPVYESSALSSTLDGDTNDNIVYGDFSNFVIADRIGASVRFIPDLFATGANRPSGQSGFFMHWRVGSDSVNDTGFVLLYGPST